MDPHYSQQPGLEVVHQHGLEVAVQEYDHSLPEVRADEYILGGKETILPPKYPIAQSSEYPEYYASPSQGPAELASTGPPGRRKRLWFVIGGVIAVVVILGAVLGGVLGSRAAKSSAGSSEATQTGGGGNPNPPPAGNNTAPANTTAAAPQSIRAGSGLSVTGWRKPSGGVEPYLFYQDPKDGLRYSRCDTSKRTLGNDSACWEAPVSFNSFATAGTRLAASTALWGDKYQPQIEIFYAGFKTRLLGADLNPQLTPNTSDSSVNQVQVTTTASSGLTAYWPWTIYQSADGVLYHVRNRLLGLFAPSPTDWDNNRTNISALSTSPLAIVPMSSNFSRIAIKGGYAVFHLSPTTPPKLAVSITDLTSPQLASDYPLSWPTTLPDITPKENTPLAAFSVARQADELQRVDTYVLYREEKGGVSVLYTATLETGMQWKIAAGGKAFEGMDDGSEIACLTMATSFYDAVKAGVVLEEAGAETARCFFQKVPMP
ncbi:hypothetical protein C8A05DRAFT_33333 [Staphylotrichum tortipilum]|uniref:Fucose-specific lectin n=1 Tax=Staphylotrichum tortipilum TaxID=2831512 RepID=A0AAN6ML72_9PEZI|nr:hypothetical protein C8A05DRAFT_33333 [Staphylotrichum longicolle]